MAASDSHSEYEMNSGASLQRKSFSDMQPCCWIISGAHSAFQTSTAFSLSDGSILMWMRRMIDMGVLPAGMTDDGTITHNVVVTQRPDLDWRTRAIPWNCRLSQRPRIDL